MPINDLPLDIKILMVPQMDTIYAKFLEIMEDDRMFNYEGWKGYNDKQVTLDWLKNQMIPFYESFEHYEKCDEIQKMIELLEI